MRNGGKLENYVGPPANPICSNNNRGQLDDDESQKGIYMNGVITKRRGVLYNRDEQKDDR